MRRIPAVPITLMTLGGLLSIGTWAERHFSARDKREMKRPGTMCSVGGHCLHACLEGDGDTLVVLEAGAGEWSVHWGQVSDRLAPFCRVLSYDRAGLGFSDEAHGRRDCPTIAQELSKLIQGVIADVEQDEEAETKIRRVLYVGHSFGGLIAMALQRTIPELIAGWVFVDAYVPGFDAASKAAIQRDMALPKWMFPVMRGITTVGLARAIWVIQGRFRNPDADPDWLKSIDARTLERQMLWLSVQRTLEREFRDNEDADATFLDKPVHFPQPAIILAARHTLDTKLAPKGVDAAAHNERWLQFQSMLFEQCAQAELRYIEGSHLLQLEEPAAVRCRARSARASLGRRSSMIIPRQSEDVMPENRISSTISATKRVLHPKLPLRPRRRHRPAGRMGYGVLRDASVQYNGQDSKPFWSRFLAKFDSCFV